MKRLWRARASVVCVAAALCAVAMVHAQSDDRTVARQGALDGIRHRVLVSTDIGGTDPDDFQSLVHLLLYADVLDIEGLVSSPYGPGRKSHILDVVDRYERDYPNLKTWSARYPTPAALRDLAKQGETEVAPYAGVRGATEGSTWIVRAARQNDPRPLHVLVWGGLEDLAQALHDAPDILPKLRVYFIGGPNKKWSVDAYCYIATHHPRLWMIESNATYRGWFVGGDQSGEWGNRAFVETHVAGRGALGAFFATQLEAGIKMGDTPSVGRLLRGAPDDPTQPGWGGRYVRTWDRSPVVYERLTTGDDRIEQFGVLELVVRGTSPAPPRIEARMVIENQSLAGHVDAEGRIRFRFSPKDARRYDYELRSSDPALDRRKGAITAVPPPADAASRPSSRHPSWWTDDPSPTLAEAEHLGARSVSQWRLAFLRDFADRLTRASQPSAAAPAEPPRRTPLHD